MNKIITFLLLFVFPGLALADNYLTFAPPPSDYSMVFLANLFGIVDGVLAGTGSQIMGSMFAVFNSAVLALGGIIIMYTLIVSTMNTAHEGQMLGQKWSSIWIPMRSTIGLTLLIPKASGYCLMQIFVMWIVVQGVGAADKVWNAALSYLNRGGVIIQAQQVNPANPLVAKGGEGSGVATGALNILAGQVCMLGLQTQLQTQRQNYLNDKQNNVGPCAGSPSADMQTFCNTNVPDFLGSVNVVTVQDETTPVSTASSYSVEMPHFDVTSNYAFLNGICGKITWNQLNSLTNIITTQEEQNTNSAIKNFGLTEIGKPPSMGMENANIDVSGSSSSINSATSTVGENTTIGGVSLNPDELKTTQMSRAIAIQQMYVDLATVARVIINNSPSISGNNNNNNDENSNPPFSAVARQQFGVPYTQNSTICTIYEKGCFLWGAALGSTAILFNGTEFLNALSDYNGVMMPTLNLLRQMQNSVDAAHSRSFIAAASDQGWMMAGAYFFNLVQIQGSSTMNAEMVDSNTGLEKSTSNPNILLSPFGENHSCTGEYPLLCTWFRGNSAPLSEVVGLINGSTVVNNPLDMPSMAPSTKREPVLGLASSTVYGFVNNSVMVQLPGQPGIKPLTFANTINFSVNTSLYTLKQQSFSCGEVKIVFFHVCLGRMLGDLFYNVIFLFVYNTLLLIFGKIIDQVVMAFLMVPLSGMADIFKQGVQVLQQPGANPIVAMANMGVQYINFSGNLWMMLLNMAVTSALIPIFGIFIFAVISLAMPLVIAWVGVMTSIGFVTAYYIPILPYMIFTFGALSWLISVVEAMVAAPIVALGITHPEGHEAFGKGEPAVMILINVFLRPSMMIIGYISAIALSYVGVWILNSGYDQATAFIQEQNTTTATWGVQDMPAGTGGYSDWAGVYAFFFSILTYTSMYLILVQKSFTLISYLPDKVLRWIGGNPESLGQESAGWAGEVKEQQKPGADKTSDATGQMGKQLGGGAMKKMSSAMDSMSSGSEASASSNDSSSTPSAPGGGSASGGGGSALGGGGSAPGGGGSAPGGGGGPGAMPGGSLPPGGGSE